LRRSLALSDLWFFISSNEEDEIYLAVLLRRSNYLIFHTGSAMQWCLIRFLMSYSHSAHRNRVLRMTFQILLVASKEYYFVLSVCYKGLTRGLGK
jgi:hypothetical protein